MAAADNAERLAAQWHEVATGVARVQRRIDQAMERAGLPAQWFAVLHALLIAEDFRLPMSVLARDLSMTSGGFTKLADRMARDGLIDRRGSALDRRVVNATLTTEGIRLARHGSEVYAEALKTCLTDVVSVEEVAAAGATLRRLGEVNIIDESGDAGPTPTDRAPGQPERRARPPRGGPDQPDQPAAD